MTFLETGTQYLQFDTTSIRVPPKLKKPHLRSKISNWRGSVPDWGRDSILGTDERSVNRLSRFGHTLNPTTPLNSARHPLNQITS